MNRFGFGFGLNIGHKIGDPSSNNAPVINDQTCTVAENSAHGTVVGTVAATDADNDSLFFAIFSGNDFSIFAIDEDTGELTIDDNTSLNYEFLTQHTLVIRVSDGTTSSDGNITVNVTNVGELPAGAYSRLDGVQVLDNGYAMTDVSANLNHAPLVKSYCYKFGSSSSYITGLPEAACTLQNNGVTIYRFGTRIDDLTIAYVNPQTNVLFQQSIVFASRGGISIVHAEKRLAISISNSTAIVTLTTLEDLAIDFYNFAVKVDVPNKLMTFYKNGVAEEAQSFSALTGTTGFASSGRATDIGKNGTTGRFSISYFEVEKDGVITFRMPMQEGLVSGSKSFDIVSGASFAHSGMTLDQTNDLYPGNLLNGYSLYQYNNSPYPFYYVPYVHEGGILAGDMIPATHGLTIGTTGTTWHLVGEYPSGQFHNLCETLIKVKTGVEKLGSEMLATPYSQYVPGEPDSASVNDILCYDEALTETQLLDALLYMEYTRPEAWIEIGDSIISIGHGATDEEYDSLIASLTGDLADPQPLAKIADYLSRSVVTLTPAYSTQAHVADYFAPRLSQALEYGQEVWICGYSVSGSSLWGSWRPLDAGFHDYLDITKLTIDDLFFEMVRNKKYPIFKVDCSLGTNDGEISGDAVTLFGEHYGELMADLRAYVGQSAMEFNILRPRKNSANKIAIAEYFEGLAVSDANTKVYDLEKYYTASQMPDGIHFNYDGTIQCGIDLANKNCLLFGDAPSSDSDLFSTDSEILTTDME